jgi:hypothetical protein
MSVSNSLLNDALFLRESSLSGDGDELEATQAPSTDVVPPDNNDTRPNSLEHSKARALWDATGRARAVGVCKETLAKGYTATAAALGSELLEALRETKLGSALYCSGQRLHDLLALCKLVDSSRQARLALRTSAPALVDTQKVRSLSCDYDGCKPLGILYGL